MKQLKKIAIIVAVALVLVLLANSFIVESIKDRAIILGMGIDYENGEFNIICEVLASSSSSLENGGGNGGSFTELVTGKGETISLAVYDVYSKTGKLPSLGQCGVLVLGESLYKEESLEQCLAYFLLSDAYRDSSLIACCKGSAKELFSKMTPMDSSISFAIQSIITGSEHNTGVPYSYMAKFIYMQMTPSAADFLTVITFEPEKETEDEKQKKESGFFVAKDIAVFRNYCFVDMLTEKEIKGLTLLNEPQSFDTFVLKDPEATQSLPSKVGVGIRTKKVNKELNFENDKISYDIKINVHAEPMHTDTTGDVQKFLAKEKSELNESMKTQLKEQITDCVNAAVLKLVAINCDYMGISNQYFHKFGKKWVVYQQDQENVYEQIKFSIKVEIQ